METTDLQYFLAVARAKGMTRASEELRTVQSNISSRIRALENEVGVPLFLRHARGVTLTSAGEKFLPYAERVVQLMREGIDLIGDVEDPRGRLAIGAMETTAGWRLPGLLAAYTFDCPQVDLLLETGPTDDLVQGVLDHRLDGAFVAGPVGHPELQEAVVFTEELVLVTSRHEISPESALVSGQKVLVFRSGCSYRGRLLTLMGSQGVNAPAVMEFGTLEGILGCVAAGMGITLLPRKVVSGWASRDQVAMHPLDEGIARSQTAFIRRTDATLSPAMARFLEQVEATSKSADREPASR
ncbi:LysR family transcriptional regulator [Arthrobacter sp. W4I7]|uniref:LysR family transcriptional regulator n=1 Tax=Arthrobacter sp. W4I7 TaxID=3042296 RepID=UPI00277E4CB2|nr:LysR family transcriptional regulator [Arthrobacter sp. W4I7]MDQ0689075.1 DNA-binding transcriptional LysR family regulator [Arthrobacter sp. W4I7]